MTRDSFKVSVIIPVYNAASFVEEAVESAIHLTEVGEVILVEDGSKDNSLEVCNRIVAKYSSAVLVTHSNRKNKGASASRNLGIQHASFEYIAFLDADDWYEPFRFRSEKDIFQNGIKFDAVYSLSAIAYQNGEIEEFGIKIVLEDYQKKLGTKRTYQFGLEEDLIIGHTNANTFRKEVLLELNGFDERLTLHQDTELWLRFSRKFSFISGELDKPVSIARRHSNNRITGRSRSSKMKLLLVIIDNIGLNKLYDFERKYVIYHIARAISNPIRPHFMRKALLHGFQFIIHPIRAWFIPFFYNWGMKHYKLK
ncbi:glycosyltransferase family 2 protein [Echinicola marina]|uniref:glycosyltransferase family 2 protein n=1 Tax=Echinicola marina TaxID=2859768 RepID=UPI001CF665B2|nr:glycosyltransferase family 2 protein [Echinicola marina]UCS91995.1 glycosyltransferase family 2 protein [Echinicola marina]